MARIMAIDFGTKRTGLAVTDPLQIIATALTTVSTHELFDFLKNYFIKEEVELVLLGIPVREDGKESHSTPHIKVFFNKFTTEFKNIPIEFRDESFTSQRAMEAMIISGTKKKKRREKGNLDKISATIILQEYLEENSL